MEVSTNGHRLNITENAATLTNMSFRANTWDRDNMKLLLWSNGRAPKQAKGESLMWGESTGQENPGTQPSRHISPSCSSTACEMSSLTVK